jgi:hypothetical protein
VQNQTKPEVPLELVAEKVQPEPPEPTAKENIPAVTADTTALIRAMQFMQQNMQDVRSALQTQV